MFSEISSTITDALSDLCKYRDMFGEPGKGIHAYRIFGMAAVDLVVTAFVAIILSRWFMPRIGVIPMFAGLFISSIAIHRAFCVNTAVIRALGLATHG